MTIAGERDIYVENIPSVVEHRAQSIRKVSRRVGKIRRNGFYGIGAPGRVDDDKRGAPGLQ